MLFPHNVSLNFNVCLLHDTEIQNPIFQDYNVFKPREIAYEPRQYVHYLVYYLMAKLLLGEVTAYILYCSL